ncbi:hypothetical protein C8F01DRAFT_783599 [Mycena amicta]|nr:hypothetical protein C8F01DRAFT_783599 [Mycena amicta]
MAHCQSSSAQSSGARTLADVDLDSHDNSLTSDSRQHSSSSSAIGVESTLSFTISNTSYNNSTSTQRQDVRSVNSAASHVPSTAPRSHGLSSAPLESPLSSHLHHVPIVDNTRPRTSPVFTSPQDLAAHYGIPQNFPPAPRPIPSRIQQPTSPLFDFETIRKNYIAMLQHKPTDLEPTPSDSAPAALAGADAMQALNDLLASPEFQNYDSFDAASPLFEDSGSASASVSPLFEDNASFDSYLTSPMETPYDDFGTSPLEDSPFSDFLTTPILPSADGDLLTGPLIEDVGYGDDSLNLFGGVSAFPIYQVSSHPKLPPTPELYTLSPGTPPLDSVDPTTTVFPAKPKSTAPAPPSPPPTRGRRSKATGTRKNLKPEALIPMDAPTQRRSYAIPSATSRKAVPAVFAQKKRLHSAAFDEDEIEPLSPTATEKEAIEHKRRQNTLAARKSRKRKLEHQQMLEDELTALNADRDRWKARALEAQEVLRANGITLTYDDD